MHSTQLSFSALYPGEGNRGVRPQEEDRFDSSRSGDFDFSIDMVDMKATLEKFYSKFCAEKLDRIDFLLTQYINDEETLLEDLTERYNVNENEMKQFLVLQASSLSTQLPKKPAKPAKPMPFSVRNDEDDDDELHSEDGEEQRGQRASLCTDQPIRHGMLTKIRIKDGAKQSMFFVLKQDGLYYIKKKPLDGAARFFNRLLGFDFGTSKMIERNTRSLDIMKLMATKVGSEDLTVLRGIPSLQDENADCILVLRSKRKSFYMIAPSVSEQNGWFNDIESTRKTAQLGDVDNPDEKKLLTVEQTCPLYTLKTEIQECAQCGRSFGFFARRHHCRECGVVVCDACSRNKVRIPRLDPYMLFKTCNACAAILKNQRRYGAASVI